MKRFMSLFLLIIVCTLSGDAELFELQKLAESKIPESLIIPDLGSITIDSDGNVYAFAGRSNGQECFIVKFDNNLNYLLHFGREGQGPGEFRMTNTTPDNRLSIDPGNNDVYVIDYNPIKLVVFDKNGNYKDDISMRDIAAKLGFLGETKIINSGLFMARLEKREEPAAAVIFSFEPSQILVKYPLDTLRIYVMVGTSGIIGATETYYGDNHFMEANESLVVFGNSQKYKFDVYDLDGEKILEIEDPKRSMGTFKKKELNKIGERYARTKENNLPLYNEFMKQVKKRKNVIAAIKLDGENVFVFPVRKDITVENRYPVEIYNRHGKIISKGFVDRIPDKIWNGFAFFIEYDDEFFPRVVKYKISGI